MKSLIDKPFMAFHEFKSWLKEKENKVQLKEYYWQKYGSYCNMWRSKNEG